MSLLVRVLMMSSRLSLMVDCGWDEASLKKGGFLSMVSGVLA